jgi:hypothetical protein
MEATAVPPAATSLEALLLPLKRKDRAEAVSKTEKSEAFVREGKR